MEEIKQVKPEDVIGPLTSSSKTPFLQPKSTFVYRLYKRIMDFSP